jgi:tetratricopeptide (TPR) repeat protein
VASGRRGAGARIINYWTLAAIFLTMSVKVSGGAIMNMHSRSSGIRGAMAALCIAATACVGVTVWAAAAPPAPILTPEQAAKLLEDGTNILNQGNAELALKNYFEPVNQSFMRQTAKAGPDDEIYATHSATETAAYTEKVAKENEGAAKPLKLVTVDGAWTDALVLKARALAKLNRVSEAMSALNQASTISPAYPPVWLEMGSIYRDQKDWERSFKAYKTAENFAGAIEDKAKQTDALASALRGQGAAMIELGRLDDAETLYKRCLKMNPGDTAATDGLAQVQARRAASAPAAPPAGSAPAAAPPTR